MKKTIVTLALALAFTAASTIAAYSFTCEVTSVEGTTVTLKCQDKYTEKLKAGENVKVSVQKAKAVEGC